VRDIWKDFRDRLQDDLNIESQILDDLRSGRIRHTVTASDIAQLEHQVDYLAKFIAQIEREHLS